ncbi:ISNCY family transposase [candidate division TA06 bacterium]|uniref:ISNCY family transposase n=1 Tax=candidate division TA06 bacterium TaxID=2250710 RepID=A0A933I9X8_UNCT6|nr:ISNCY family transposase [candidate division TA06 bacterium]
MKLFADLCLRFENPLWAHYPELAVMDSILDTHPELLKLVEQDILGISNDKGFRSRFGRKDTPSIEQIVRAAIYKETKRIDYRKLEAALYDSTVCRAFVKLNGRRPFSFVMLHNYISRIRPETIERLIYAINSLMISEGMENVQKVRIDSTVMETPIHYPTNNALVWDCFKEFYRLIFQLRKHDWCLNIRCYRKQAKKQYYKINLDKSPNRRQLLFGKQLGLFRRIIAQAAEICQSIEASDTSDIMVNAIGQKLRAFLPVMDTVYSQSYRREILNETVPNHEKLFSIYEQHTDIIVKGQREVQFGHKINLSVGKSNLILDCIIADGNPKDSTLFEDSLKRIRRVYNRTPQSVSTDGGYASLKNVQIGLAMGIRNIVFNKIVGSLENIASSKSMETRLKKWRSGIEAVISNWKRRFEIFRCEWKTKPHYDAKVLWSVLAYNLRVIAAWYLDAICSNA